MKFRIGILIFLGIASMAFYMDKSIEISYPAYFPKPEYDFKNNILCKEKVELGRALFYDPILSKDNSISCASCHSPYNAFAHSDHNLSHGINDQIGTRNAPALFNLAWHKSFMWDGAINHLDMQALAPISHPGEMDESIENIVKKLKAGSIYPSLFYAAYGDSSISGVKFLKAMAYFQLTLLSVNSKYDRVKNGEEVFSKQEESGYKLFVKNCSSCHSEPLFSNFQFANNGLPIDSSLMDFGKGAISKQSADSLTFKIPSLRNLGYSSPYMHDGRFKTLNEVLNHYTKGISENKTLAKELKNPIKLSSNDKVDLIAFLQTLNDAEFVFNPENKFPRNILLPAKD